MNAKGEVFYVVPVPEKELSIFQVMRNMVMMTLTKMMILEKAFRIMTHMFEIHFSDKQRGEEREEDGEKGFQALETGEETKMVKKLKNSKLKGEKTRKQARQRRRRGG